MRMYDIIEKKKLGKELTEEEIALFVNGYTNGTIPDYQMSALCMAICLRSMTKDETFYLTKYMLNSGEVVDLSRFGNLSVDKHSTGGVGDKTTLIVAPIVASLGLKVAKMSGRGLGFTGGTVDKLESISGYKTSLDASEFLSQVEKVGIAVVGQSGNLAPADKKIYALRDVTCTVDSIPLIASSIMSKKLASGSHNIVLDVKCGSGAFMKDKESATSLAKAMVEIGKSFGRNVCAIITDMDAPLGKNIGNALEVKEAIEILQGKGDSNLKELCLIISANMVSLALNIDYDEAYKMVEDTISSGSAFEKMKEWIYSQGGNVKEIEDPSLLPKAKYESVLKLNFNGYISGIDAEKIGIASMLLGAGRKTKEDTIDNSAGIVLNVKIGDSVEDKPYLTMYSSDPSLFEQCEKALLPAFKFSDEKPEKKSVVLDIVR